jgi:NADH-quinone oxidoreductase subunit A
MDLVPLALYLGAVVALIGAMVGVPWLIAPRHRELSTGEPYESGMVPTGAPEGRLSVRFYLVAIIFVIFDLEAVFLYAWAVSAPETGWFGYLEAVVFIVILLLGLAYLWRQGALEWGTAARTAGDRRYRREAATSTLTATQT